MADMSKNGRLEVITTDESGRWDEILQQVGAYAFYHRAAYHRLAENRGEGEACLLYTSPSPRDRS